MQARVAVGSSTGRSRPLERDWQSELAAVLKCWKCKYVIQDPYM